MSHHASQPLRRPALRAGFVCLLAFGLAGCPLQSQSAAIIGIGDLPHGVVDVQEAIGFYRDVLGLELLSTTPPLANGTLGPNVYDAKLQALMDVGGAYYRIAVFRVPGTDARLRLYELINNQGIFRLRGARQSSAAPTERGSLMLRLPRTDVGALSATIRSRLMGDVLTREGPANTHLKALTVRDDDGFLIQFVQTPKGSPAAAAQGTPPAIVLTAANAERKLRFYRDVLGFELAIGDWESDGAALAAVGLDTGRLRRSVGVVPGTDVPFEIHEYDGVKQRRFFPTSVGQAGVGWIQLLVRDLDGLISVFTTERIRIVSTGLQPVSFEDSRRVVVRDPDGVFIELVERYDNATR